MLRVFLSSLLMLAARKIMPKPDAMVQVQQQLIQRGANPEYVKTAFAALHDGSMTR